MREIKFRAWVLGKMYEVKNLEWDWGHLTITTDGGWIALPDPKAHLMEFTGLYDKNGVEIYEEDILVADGDDGRHGGKQYFQIMYGEGSGTVGFSPHCITGDYSSVHYEVWDKGEVIGNIHENPELLESPDA
jgi:hypothetical protein